MNDLGNRNEETAERRLDDLEEKMYDLEETVSVGTDRDISLLKGTVRALVAAEVEKIDDLPDAVRSFREDCANREDRLQTVEAQLGTLGETETGSPRKPRTTRDEAFVSPEQAQRQFEGGSVAR